MIENVKESTFIELAELGIGLERVRSGRGSRYNGTSIAFTDRLTGLVLVSFETQDDIEYFVKENRKNKKVKLYFRKKSFA